MSNSEKQQELEAAAKVEKAPLLSCKIFDVRLETLHFPDGSLCEWTVIDHPGAVAMIPVDTDGNLLLIQQWRRPVKKILIEIPAGCIDPGESLEQAAQRELQEEVGVKADELIPFGSVYPVPGYSNEQLHFFLARGLTRSSLEKDMHEAIDVAPTPLSEALEMIDSGEIEDAKTIMALLRYERWKSRHA